MEKKPQKFEVIVLGIIFDSKKKKILITKRNEKLACMGLEWCFPGGRLQNGEDIDKALKRIIKLKTGYSIKNIGTFFSQTHPENPNIVSITFLTKVFDGEENPGDDVVELKWVKVEEIDGYFEIPIHKKLSEFLHELI